MAMSLPAPLRRVAINDQDGRDLLARLDRLAGLSSDAEALTRLYLTSAHKDAITLVSGWMAEAGMTVEIDAAATVVGRYPATVPGAKTLILGSHIDTVRNAGRFDGALGVAAAIAAVAALHAAGRRLPFAIEVVAFGDEEGMRFPVTLTGSHALAGTFDPVSLMARDADDITLAEALASFGCDPAGIAGLGRDPSDLLGYIEVHIEQGPVLETEDLPVGIVSAIAGASRLAVTLTGQAGHAGTVPMRLRRDALAAAAEMTLAVERVAIETPDLVATVGRLDLHPGAVNVIPGRVAFTLDVRSPYDPVRHNAVELLRQRFSDIAIRRGLHLHIASTYDEAAAPCAPWLIEAWTAAVARLGLRPLELPSGAGHDGLAMASLCPIGMLFVRCADGISHNPAESVTAADAAVAVATLRALLDELAAR